MGDHNNFSTCSGCVELDDGLDGHRTISETTADAADDARRVRCVEPNVMSLSHLSGIHQRAASPAACREKWVQASGIVAGLSDAGNIENVGHNGGCCRPGPCSGAVEHHTTDRLAFHQNGIVHAVDAKQRMICWNKRRLYAKRQG